MLISRNRKMHYEEVPPDAASSFIVREFRWPRFPFNWHYHAELELTLILQGEGLRFVGDSVEEFDDGDLCLIGANTPHCWASHPKASKGVRSLVIQFLPESWGQPFWGLPEMQLVRQLLVRAQRGLKIQGTIRAQIREIMLAMVRQRAGSLERWSSLFAILARLAKSRHSSALAALGYEQPLQRQTDKKLGKILESIHTHLGEELTQGQLAKAVGSSPQSFSRFFKHAMGKPYVQYVNELKIHKVCRALIETDASITEVALDAGFNNLSHFNEQFLRFKKVTPKAYRLRARHLSDAPLPSR